MFIDIEPHKVRQATHLESICMDIYGYKELFYFEQNGKEISVQWTEEKLLEFLPRMSVNDYIESTTLSGISNFVKYRASWERCEHPLWTTLVQEEGNWRKETKPMPLDYKTGHVTNSARFLLKDAYYKATNPLIFVKITK